MSTIAEIQQQCEYKMKRTIESLRDDLSKLRTGRASTGILEHVMVDYYGSPTPISQVANLGVADARTITVQPWDRKMIPVIEKAILTADLGLNPAAFGDMVRVPVPPLTVVTAKTPRLPSAICVVMPTNMSRSSKRPRK